MHDVITVDGGPAVRNDLYLEWSGNLAQGTTAPLTGRQLRVPDDQPGGGRFYCITSDEIGAAPERGVSMELIKLRIDGLREEENCSGPVVIADLRGCMFRT
jgi:hypothetical protein